MDIHPYLPQFKAIVLTHLNEMDEDLWATFRHRAGAFEGDVRAVDPDYVIDADETRQSVLNAAVTVDSGLSVEDVLQSARKFEAGAVSIGEIESQPVYYIDGFGVYLWGKTPSSAMTLSFWATFPAYPSGW